MKKLLAIDPGKTTGICILNTTQDGFEVDYVGEMLWDDRFRISKALVAGMWPQRELRAAASPPEVVIIERFRLRQGRAYQQSGSDFPSIQVQAIIETFVYLRNLNYEHINVRDDLNIPPIEVAYQEPICMARVQILPDHHYLIAGSEHLKDAYKHARYYYETKVKQR